jgi:hypothetical protein
METKQKNITLKQLEFESGQQDNAVNHAIDHLRMAQSIMYEELDGRNPIGGMYSEFRTLIKLLEKYKNSNISVGI